MPTAIRRASPTSICRWCKTAWRGSPFVADPSLGYFLANIAQTNPATKIGLGITLAVGLFTGGGSGPARPRSAAPGD